MIEHSSITGRSRLAFRYRPDVDATYHFAFNIPEDRILAASSDQTNAGSASPISAIELGHPTKS